MCLLPTIGNIVVIGAMWTNDPDKIRIGQLSVTTPCWLVYNVFTWSISGIITESFNLVSICVYYVRQAVRKKKEKKVLENEEP